MSIAAARRIAPEPVAAQPGVHVVLPAFNEAAGLGILLARIRHVAAGEGWRYRVYVVDDGSRDGTHAVARAFAGRMPLEVLRQPRNRGVAAAFEAAFARVCEVAGPDDLCFTLDADNTHDPAGLVALKGALEEAEVAIASRFAAGGGMTGVPAFRRLLSHAARMVLPRLLPVPGARDYSTFFRGYRVALLRRARARWPDGLMEGRGFSSVVLLLHRVASIGGRVAEVPGEVRYELKAGASGMRIASTVRGYLEVVRRGRREARPGGRGDAG